MEIKKLNIVGEEDFVWVHLDNFNFDAEILDKIQVIHCDTRDFAISWSLDCPKHIKDAKCGFEQNQNEGLKNLYSLLKKQNRENYTINKKDILKWLDELCQKAGGYDKEWRYLSANLKNCQSWDIKYIRFVRNNKNKDEFIVCNSYLFPIQYKEIIKNLDVSSLCCQ